MSSKDQFTGLDMNAIIGKPLVAVSEANKKMAEETTKFIKKSGFDNEGKARIVNFDDMLNENETASTKK